MANSAKEQEQEFLLLGDHNDIDNIVNISLNDSKALPLSEIEQNKKKIKSELRALKTRLEEEEEMAGTEDFEALESEYLKDISDRNGKLKYACLLIRSKNDIHKRSGLRLLYSLYETLKATKNEEHGKSYLVFLRTVLYYLAVANYKLHFYEEALRFVRIILDNENEQKQALTFEALLLKNIKQRILILLDNSTNSHEIGLAFNRALEFCNPKLDKIIFLTIFEDDPTKQGNTLFEAARAIHKKYYLICDERNIRHVSIYKVGHPREVIPDVTRQEKITSCVNPFTHSDKKGLFSRVLTAPNLHEYLVSTANCDLFVVKHRRIRT